ncbi:hypothetical protein [Burkholderia sp. SIMBA_062]|uniref:hypothetical protein n=1 Tax=Burkholderia sp. SIMBA_062 TaxID=3085803 RepID=UPI00397B3994
MSEILTEAEKSSIRGVAAGDKAQIEAARATFNRAAPEHGVDACVELQFMARSTRAGSGSAASLAVSCGRAEADTLNRKQ